MTAIQSGELDASIAYVFCNREPGEQEGSDEYIALVRSYGIPLVTFSTRRYLREQKARLPQVRAQHDQEIIRRIPRTQADLTVLAGYGLIFSPQLCRATMPAINLHPAAPDGPIGTWQNVIWELIEQRATHTGARVHVVTEALDMGPVITYTSFPIQGEPYAALWPEAVAKPVSQLKDSPGEELALFKAIRAEGVRREQPLLLETLIAFARGALRATPSGVLDAEGRPLTAPLCLNEAVERRLVSSGRR
jgi:folate-dependent phosphoribosylglycinamide formyltransferase PurN